MATLAIGLVLGFAVSIPPGPNSALCVSLASGGVRRAMPLITGAALTDAAYSLLAASGILLASRTGVETLRYLTPAFLFATAALTWWPTSIPSRAFAAVPVLNPATALIWLGLSSVPALQALSLPEALLRPIPVALGTATWFVLLAVVSAKAGTYLGPGRLRLIGRWVGGLLVVLGLAELLALLT
ncbi:MAG TPA: hypothetical protein VMT37_13790 [Solirubrobacterales bacterium]|nr:hypothetical protein [Solirubrobacterales bacterium]